MRIPVILPFWERAKKLIRVHKISMNDFAEYIDIKSGTFRNWVCYGILPDVVTGVKIANALGVTVDYLVYGKGSSAMIIREKQILERKKAAASIRKLASAIEKNTEVF